MKLFKIFIVLGFMGFSEELHHPCKIIAVYQLLFSFLLIVVGGMGMFFHYTNNTDDEED